MFLKSIRACRGLHDSALFWLQESSGAPSAVTSPSGTARSGSPFDAALDGRALLESRLRSHPRAYREHSEHAGTPHNQRRAALWREVEELECPLAASQVPEAPVVSEVKLYITFRTVLPPYRCAIAGVSAVRMGDLTPLSSWGVALQMELLIL